MSKRKVNPTLKNAPVATRKTTFAWSAPALALLVAVVCYFTYRPAFEHAFLDWDDQLYVTENPMLLQAGQPSAPDVWDTPIALNYHPLTMQTLLMNAGGPVKNPAALSARPFIATNVWLHLLNSLLVFVFVWLLARGNLFASFFSAWIFALHPMHVESVAWISERKDVLYTFFFLGAGIAYLRYVRGQTGLWWAFALVLFVLSCLSKAMAVSLVPVLFLVDWWEGRSLKSGRVWIEKIPFIAVALLFGLIAMDIQSGGNFHGWFSNVEGVKTATAGGEHIGLFERLQLAAYGMVQYLIRFVAPHGLSPFYPYPAGFINGEGLPAAFTASLLVFTGIAAAGIWSLKKGKIAFWSLAFYFFTVVLVSQFIAVGLVIMADRYTYVPYIGLAMGLTLGLWHWAKEQPNLQYLVWGLMSVFSIYLAVLTHRQIGVWKNTETLWQAALKEYPNDGQILANLGNYYGKNGKVNEAATCFEKALQGNVRNAMVFEGLGNVYGARNEHQKAAEMFSEAIKIDPRKGNFYYNRGTAYSQFDPTKAIEDFNKALELMPPARHADLFARRAFCYLQLKNYEKAIADYDQALNKGPRSANLYFDRGAAKFNGNNREGAILDFREALRIDPNFEPAKSALQQLTAK